MCIKSTKQCVSEKESLECDVLNSLSSLQYTSDTKRVANSKRVTRHRHFANSFRHRKVITKKVNVQYMITFSNRNATRE